jgi:hypothetical protein
MDESNGWKLWMEAMDGSPCPVHTAASSQGKVQLNLSQNIAFTRPQCAVDGDVLFWAGRPAGRAVGTRS